MNLLLYLGPVTVQTFDYLVQMGSEQDPHQSIELGHPHFYPVQPKFFIFEKKKLENSFRREHCEATSMHKEKFHIRTGMTGIVPHTTTEYKFVTDITSHSATPTNSFNV